MQEGKWEDNEKLCFCESAVMFRQSFNFVSMGASERDMYVHPQIHQGDSLTTYLTGLWTQLVLIKLF